MRRDIIFCNTLSCGAWLKSNAWNQRAPDPEVVKLQANIKDLRERMAAAVHDLQIMQGEVHTIQRVWGLAMSAEYHLTLKLSPPLGQGPERIET